MSKHTAPTIVIETQDKGSFLKPVKTGFLTLHPSVDPVIHPLGSGQPGYQRNAVLLNEAQASAKRREMTEDGYDQFTWSDIPEYLQEHILLGEELTGEMTVWVLGNLPTDRLDKEETSA